MQLQTPHACPRLLKLPLLFLAVFEKLVASMEAFVGKAVLSGQRVIPADLRTGILGRSLCWPLSRARVSSVPAQGILPVVQVLSDVLSLFFF